MRSFSESHGRLSAKLHISSFACAWPTYTSSYSSPFYPPKGVKQCLRLCGAAAVAVQLGRIVRRRRSLNFKVTSTGVLNCFLQLLYCVVVQSGIVFHLAGKTRSRQKNRLRRSSSQLTVQRGDDQVPAAQHGDVLVLLWHIQSSHMHF